jgi:uncharacterized phage-associated protein
VFKINDVCDYIIIKLVESGEHPSILKLQKLLYYVQAWNLAINNQPLFDGKFEAWVHGPVNRQIYSRFVATKYMYSSAGRSDVLEGQDNLLEDAQFVIDDVLELYAPFSGSQLEEMTHKEDPWLNARGDLAPSVRCETDISEADMKSFYSSRL